MSAIRQHLNFKYKMETTRKGFGSKMRFETRVVYRGPNTPDNDWEELPEVFFKSRLNKKEVGEALRAIILRVLPVGQRVNTHNGPATIEGTDGEFFQARLDYFSKQSYQLHPHFITEVL